MKFKTCQAFLKAAGAAAEDEAGTFEAIVSVFGNVDSVGDLVRPGAFKDSLTEWKASGNPIPVYWSHRMDDPQYNIGVITEAAELAPGDARIPDWAPDSVKQGGGLYVKGRLDTDADASPVAVQTRRLLAARRVTQFSYAYDEEDSGWIKQDGRQFWELRKLRLYEVSPTPIGANQDTTLIGAKAATLPDGGIDELASGLAALDALIDAADEQMDNILALLGIPDTDTDEQMSGEDMTGPAKARAAAVKAALVGRQTRRNRAAGKAGRVLSSKNEDSIRQAVKLLDGVLSTLDGTQDEEAKREEPHGVKREEPTRIASDRLLIDLHLLEAQVA